MEQGAQSEHVFELLDQQVPGLEVDRQRLPLAEVRTVRLDAGRVRIRVLRGQVKTFVQVLRGQLKTFVQVLHGQLKTFVQVLHGQLKNIRTGPTRSIKKHSYRSYTVN